jgi:hypothetical protein
VVTDATAGRFPADNLTAAEIETGFERVERHE